MSDSVVIVAAKRTPNGSMNGQLLPLTSPQLASVAIKAAFAQSGLKAEDITEAIIGLARGLGLKVVAEGVETQAQFDFLAARDCHCFQGYFVSKPVAATDFEAFLEARGVVAAFEA